MPVVTPQYPNQVWDGLTPNTWRQNRQNHVDPDGKDWDQVSAELIAAQQHLESAGGGFITTKVGAYMNADQVLPSGTDYPILFNQIAFDTDGCFNVATGTFTAPTSGYYILFGQTNFTVAFSATALMHMRVNTVIRATSVWTQTFMRSMQLYAVVYLNAGNTVQLCAGQWSGSNKTLTGIRVNTYIRILKCGD